VAAVGVPTPTPRGLSKVVEKVFRNTAPIFHLHVVGQVIRTTGKHPFFAYNKGWMEANQLAAGDYVLADDARWVAVEGVYDTGKWEVVKNDPDQVPLPAFIDP
jgi:hypothetical protein